MYILDFDTLDVIMAYLSDTGVCNEKKKLNFY